MEEGIWETEKTWRNTMHDVRILDLMKATITNLGFSSSRDVKKMMIWRHFSSVYHDCLLPKGLSRFNFLEVGPLAHRSNTTCWLLLSRACNNGFKTWVTQIGPQTNLYTTFMVKGQCSHLWKIMFVIDWQLSTLNLATGLSATTIRKSSGPPGGPSYSKGRMGCEGNLVERFMTEGIWT